MQGDWQFEEDWPERSPAVGPASAANAGVPSEPQSTPAQRSASHAEPVSRPLPRVLDPADPWIHSAANNEDDVHEHTRRIGRSRSC